MSAPVRSDQSPLTKSLNLAHRVAIRFFLEESGLDSRVRLYADLRFRRLKMLFCVRIEWFIANVGLHRVGGRVFQLRDRAWMVYPPLED